MFPAIFLLAALADDSPAAPPVQALREKVVEAIRNCPTPAPGEISVCARDRGYAEGYRIPKLDPRYAGTNLRKSGRGELAAVGPGAAGVGSCTSSGAGGFTGCGLEDYKTWGQWKQQQKAQGQEFPW